MLQLAKVTKDDFVIDLGCGDGRIVVMAASEFGAKAMGYDLDSQRIEEANANARKANVADRVKFVEKDLFEAEIKDATVVTLYLLPSVNEKLKPRLLGELKPGTRIVSHSFRMGDWVPDETKEVDGRTVYLWTVKPRPSGK
jgi:ribosomal protein L11 methylase PrmA